jgi:seryl-tRNA synthetase
MAAYELYINNNSAMAVDEEQPMIRNKGQDGEYDHTRDLTSEQILQQQRNHMQNQDKKVDELIAITQVISGQAQDTKTELTQQNKQLDRLANDIDETNTKMIKVDNDMKKLMAATNQKVCWGVLYCEVVLLFVFLFVKI